MLKSDFSLFIPYLLCIAVCMYSWCTGTDDSPQNRILATHWSGCLDIFSDRFDSKPVLFIKPMVCCLRNLTLWHKRCLWQITSASVLSKLNGQWWFGFITKICSNSKEIQRKREEQWDATVYDMYDSTVIVTSMAIETIGVSRISRFMTDDGILRGHDYRSKMAELLQLILKKV